MAFDSLKKLRVINLSFNPLRILHKNLFQHGLPLSSLLLDSCEIEYVENGTFEGLNNLKHLTIKNNALKSNDLLCLDIPSLKHLGLSYNILDYLPVEAFSNLPLLETLYLEHCNVDKIIEGTFINNRNLEKLNIAQNIISNIPEKLFSAVNSISQLNISNNFLDYAPYNMFDNSTLIETLDMADNLIPKIELSGFGKLRKLKSLILRKNEIQLVSSSKRVVLNELILFDIKLKLVDKNTMSTLITDLTTNTHYIVCILTMYEDFVIGFDDNFVFANDTDSEANKTSNIDRNLLNALIAQSPASECVSFDTMKKPLIVKIKTNKGFKMSTILNRRTGLIVGCCLGFVVFFIMVTVLLYTKVKERKRIAKSDPAWSEMNDYHSMQSKEDIQDSTTASTDNILLGMTKHINLSFDKTK
ncbi:jg20527 [Pararge aegeria aegeria]|uniref:Jg20527 protein n=1 Tax=Pararge aegeria aegeria TaxID=348720 RepID=A0A8S4R2G6_9NEOP|nr:jg20527 [Pararge aegeria aegeria]